MAGVALKQFDGLVPRANARLLGPSQAQVATNTKITGGALRPWKAPAAVQAKRRAGTVVSMYLFEETHWFEWTTDVDVVRSPIAADTLSRTYYTGDGAPKVTSNAIATDPVAPMPAVSYLMGLPPPVTTPTLTLSGVGDPEFIENRFYVVTYVNAWYEEGPPGETTEVEVMRGQMVEMTNLPDGPGGPYNITTKRIYRTSTGANATDFQFVAEIPVAQATYNDSRLTEDLGEVLVTVGWYPPRSSAHNEPGVYSPVVTSPAPHTMVGLTQMANGILAGFAGNTLCFSEPFVPYAWPRDYELTTEWDIVALGAFGQSLAVLTGAYPYIVTGIDPVSMSMEQLPIMQACVSKRSVVSVGGGIVYASPDGLISIGSGGMDILTRNLMSREEWQEYHPESIHAYQHDGRYLAFFDTGTRQGCIVVSFAGNEPSMVEIDTYATAGFNDPLLDLLYLMVGGVVSAFDSGTPLTYTWRSKLFTLDRPANMVVAQVIAQGYPVQFTLRAINDPLTYSVAVQNSDFFRLPSSSKYRSFDVELSGTTEVEQVLVAEDVRELDQT